MKGGIFLQRCKLFLIREMFSTLILGKTPEKMILHFIFNSVVACLKICILATEKNHQI